jgi:hypothetical protein
MPHLVVYVDEIGAKAINDSFGGFKVFTDILEGSVAYEFNHLLHEHLVCGDTVVTDYVHISRSMPTSILVVVLAWWTREREQHAEELQHLITAAIRGYFRNMSPAPKITVRLEVID